MAATGPTFDDCERLVAGLTIYSSRVTVDKLKTILKGINSTYLPRVSITGNKADLVARVSASLRSAAAQRHPEYARVARLAGEAQGIQYGPASSGTSTSAVPYSSYNSHTQAPPASTASQNSMSSSSHVNGSSPAYASRSDQFGLHSPRNSPTFGQLPMPGTMDNGRPSSSTSSAMATAAPSRFNGYNGAVSTSINGANSRYPASSSSLNRYPSTSTHGTASSSMYPSTSRYGSSSLSSASNVPDRWPERLPPKGSTLPANQPAVPISFKNSPFFKVHSAVSPVVTLNRAPSGDRHSASAMIVITEDQRQKLLAARQNPQNTQWQIRLYCTSADFYAPQYGYNSYGSARNNHVLMEFPTACEAKVNGELIQANLKGIKKRPGTAAPANVGAPRKDGTSSSGYPLNLTPGAQNKVELAYVNTEKLYYMIAYLVEATTIDQIVQNIKATKHRRKEEVVKKLLQQAEDPDIQATSSTISLRDPLMFTRMKTPVRSVHCPHLQCFDISLYLQMMETTPDWKCPVCNKAITADDLVLDGFSNDIIDSVPDSVDTIIVEVDGTWRSEDNKHGNAVKVAEAKARASTAVSEGPKGNAIPDGGQRNGQAGREGSAMSLAGTPFEPKPDISRSGSTAGTNGKAKSTERPTVIELDDDDDDDDYLRGAGSTGSLYTSDGQQARPASTATAGTKSGGAVIDLTLSDDEEEVPRPAPASSIHTSSSLNDNIRKETANYSDELEAVEDGAFRSSGAGQKRRAGSDWDSDSGFGNGSESTGHASKQTRYI